jgi:tetraacyldisaccharide 4'-kinase
MSGELSTMVERAWAAATPVERALRAALTPAATAYGAVIAVRNLLYDGAWLHITRVPARVVSVGNLAVGGTGKTPTALWLAERLVGRGRRVALVARGYGKRRAGVVVVGNEGRPLVSAAEGGDEAVLLAHRFAGPVVTGERRAAAAALACERFGCDTIVLDDGFQHRALARDADLVLVSGDPSREWLLPAGPLREPSGSLRRARAVLTVGGDGVLPALPPAPGGLAVFRGRLTATALVRAGGDTWHEEPLDGIRDRDVVAVAGVARPQRFVALLGTLGARVRRVFTFPDHHRYRGRDLAALAEGARAGRLVTTEKDLVKLGGIPGLEGLRALRVALEVEDGDRLVDLLLR